MSLSNFQEHFDNTYQDILNKVLVGKVIASFRFEDKLKYGESVERFSLDLSAVRVRDVSRGSASTIDSITDSTELLKINLEKEATFHMPDGTRTQAGPLSPGEVAGKNIAIKVGTDLDARILYEVTSADQDFDAGDLTTITSSGVSFALNSTTIPQFISRAPSKLLRANVVLTDQIYVMDSLAISDFEQYLLGKSIDLAGNVFKNGYSGTIHGADVYTSENLTGEAVLSMATNMTAGDTITIGGVVLTAVSSIGTTAGNVLIGTSADDTRANIETLLNAPETTTATGVALSADDIITIKDTLGLVATNDDVADTLTIVCTGSGRLTVSKSLTAAGDKWTSNVLHAYYGQRGAIDVVVQAKNNVDVRPCSDRRGSNIFSSYLAGIKTFADGSKKFLDVLLAV